MSFSQIILASCPSRDMHYLRYIAACFRVILVVGSIVRAHDSQSTLSRLQVRVLYMN